MPTAVLPEPTASAIIRSIGTAPTGPETKNVTGFKATRARKLTPGQKQANRVLAAGRAPVEHGFANLKAWRVLTKLRTDPSVTRAPPTSTFEDSEGSR
ncbi:hypothetical protein [Streptomyces sp. NPDC048496]|uniref:hypothetical protein n=1 Tax=Streptomyces sp. NPDC048496 TaxID=3365558 RepID=UPI00371FF430